MDGPIFRCQHPMYRHISTKKVQCTNGLCLNPKYRHISTNMVQRTNGTANPRESKFYGQEIEIRFGDTHQWYCIPTRGTYPSPPSCSHSSLLRKVKCALLSPSWSLRPTTARASTRLIAAKVQGSGFRVQGSGCRVQGSGFRV
jgi:hypothetical protein